MAFTLPFFHILHPMHQQISAALPSESQFNHFSLTPSTTILAPNINLLLSPLYFLTEHPAFALASRPISMTTYIVHNATPGTPFAQTLM